MKERRMSEMREHAHVYTYVPSPSLLPFTNHVVLPSLHPDAVAAD